MLKSIDDTSFKELIRENTDPAVLYFTGKWCKPCQTFGPVVELVSQRMENDIRFFKADMDETEITASELGIRSLPSLVLFDGGMIRDLQSGTMTAEEIRLWIQENI